MELARCFPQFLSFSHPLFSSSNLSLYLALVSAIRFIFFHFHSGLDASQAHEPFPLSIFLASQKPRDNYKNNNTQACPVVIMSMPSSATLSDVLVTQGTVAAFPAHEQQEQEQLHKSSVLAETSSMVTAPVPAASSILSSPLIFSDLRQLVYEQHTGHPILSSISGCTKRTLSFSVTKGWHASEKPSSPETLPHDLNHDLPQHSSLGSVHTPHGSNCLKTASSIYWPHSDPESSRRRKAILHRQGPSSPDFNESHQGTHLRLDHSTTGSSNSFTSSIFNLGIGLRTHRSYTQVIDAVLTSTPIQSVMSFNYQIPLTPCAPSMLTSPPESDKSMLLVQHPVLHHMTSLTQHIATRGLMQGVGSDITIEVFGKTYRLHRLILTQSTFFDSLLSGPWKERGLDLIKLKLEDDHITQEGFEIAIERLYGVWTEEGDKSAKVRLPRSASHPETLSTTTAEHTIRATSLSPWNVLSVLASGAYLGIDALCEQCTAYVIHTLSTEHISKYIQFSHYCDYYPWSGKILEACHTFLCRNAYDDPKMKCLQVLERLPAPWLLTILGSDAFWVPSEWERYKFCRQVVHNRRKNAYRSSSDSVDCFDTEEESVYETLFSTCITFMHMTFEQLQVILSDCDPITGHCFVRSDIVQEALWQQTELRTLIESSSKDDGPLDLAVIDSEITPYNLQSWETPFWHRYLIPDQDKTLVGDSHFAPPSQPLPTAGLASTGTSDVKKRSLYAPFRFGVEFGDIHSLQDNIRVCSDVVFYAGSFWNVYIQKLPSQKGLQLGVYLHRHSRPQISRPSKRLNRTLHTPSAIHRNLSLPFTMWAGWESRGNGSEPQHRDGTSPFSDSTRRVSRDQRQGDPDGGSTTRSGSRTRLFPVVSKTENTDKLDGERDESHDRLAQKAVLADLYDRNLVPVEESFSCYVDKRDNTRTWFKIFAASLMPSHTIAQFQSCPDDFLIMQSWGWRSSCLCLSSYMPEDYGPKNELETKIITACTGCVSVEHAPPLPAKLEKGKHVTDQDLEQAVENLSMPFQSSSKDHKTGLCGDLNEVKDSAPMNFYDDIKDGHSSTRARIYTLNYDDGEMDPFCDCEAEEEYGHHQHHHSLRPLTLKLSIVLGHI